MYLILILILGLASGSFLGVVSSRLPRKESFVWGRSKCPKCKNPIAAFDNIPLLSFLLLRGRCRNCRQKISLRYPLLEIGTALLFSGTYLVHQSAVSPVLTFWKNALGVFSLPFFLTLVALTLLVFVIDLETKTIPDGIIFFGLGGTLLALLLGQSVNLYFFLSGGIISALFLLGVHFFTRGRGMGLGDVKYALFAGTFLGPKYSLVWLFGAFLTGAVVGIILILTGKTKLKSRIAFGPFLGLSFLFSAVWAESLIQLFLRL